MKIIGYEIEFEKIVANIIDNKYKNVALQLPDGLKNYALDIAKLIKLKTRAETIILADPCYGACDVFGDELSTLGVQLIIQIGHTPIEYKSKFGIQTLFINALSSLEIKDITEKAIKYLEGKRIGVTTTAQHVHKMQEVLEILKNKGFKPIISQGDNRINCKGQILGCNFTSAETMRDDVDSYLFVGSGIFHPVGLMLSTKKPVITADPYTKKVKKKEVEELKNSILRQRYGAIEISKNAKTFGILIGLKSGQLRKKLAFNLKKLLDDNNREAFLIAQNIFSFLNLQSLRNIDCFVSTSCPRIAIDDYNQYKKPIITPIELEIVLGLRNWDNYEFDQIKNKV